jgi:hypothetical protein
MEDYAAIHKGASEHHCPEADEAPFADGAGSVDDAAMPQSGAGTDLHDRIAECMDDHVILDVTLVSYDYPGPGLIRSDRGIRGYIDLSSNCHVTQNTGCTVDECVITIFRCSIVNRIQTKL